jgi:Arc/MetJ-type ribon-helix-helix transcriptional regulator
MTVHKIAVSLPAELVSTARRAVRQRRATSVSAYITSALVEKAKLERLEDLLREMLRESGGELTAAEIRAADRALGISRRGGPRKARRS